MQSQKWQNDLCSFPRQTIQYHSISLLMISISLMILNINIIQYHHSISIQVYALTNNAEEAEVEWFYKDLQDLLERTPKKDVLFIIGDWNAKVQSQEIPGVTGKFGLGIWNEAGQRLIDFCQENTVVKTPSSNNTREDSTHGQHQMVNTKSRLILFFIAIHKEALYSQQTNKQKTPGVDCGWDHQLFSAKFRLKLKKVEETTRPLRYGINQMAYDSIVEVTSK